MNKKKSQHDGQRPIGNQDTSLFLLYMKCARPELIKQSPVSLLYYPSEPKLTKETPINIMENIGKIKKGVTLSISLTILQSDPGCSVLNHPALINALATVKKNQHPTSKTHSCHPLIPVVLHLQDKHDVCATHFAISMESHSHFLGTVSTQSLWEDVENSSAAQILD